MSEHGRQGRFQLKYFKLKVIPTYFHSPLPPNLSPSLSIQFSFIPFLSLYWCSDMVDSRKYGISCHINVGAHHIMRDRPPYHFTCIGISTCKSLTPYQTQNRGTSLVWQKLRHHYFWLIAYYLIIRHFLTDSSIQSKQLTLLSEKNFVLLNRIIHFQAPKKSCCF